MIVDQAQHELKHYGILRRSGRYPWNSGKDLTQEQVHRSFLSITDDLRKKGLTPKEIADGFNISTLDLRNARSNARNAEKQADINMAQQLRNKGYSHQAIGERMSNDYRTVGEATVRSWLKPGELDKLRINNTVADMLRTSVAESKYVDIGVGTELHMGVSNDKLKKVVAQLSDEGYTTHYVKVPQLGTNHETTLVVLAAPNTPYSEVYAHRADIALPFQYSTDGGRTRTTMQPPLTVGLNRVGIKYAKDGGSDADGVIYVRPGVKDLSLGESRYAQVRIQVGADGKTGTHYIKGMAIYRDDLPEGTDLLFNTNKSDTGNKLDALKPVQKDPVNPFGSMVKQLPQKDAFGTDIPNTVRSAMNIVNEEGKWNDWAPSLSSQFLSKQSNALAQKQLDEAYDSKKKQLDEIRKVDNPAVQRRLYQALADDADSSSIHLKAAALPRQRTQVILPIESMKPTEVYAPNFRNGDRVVLVRHPHGGIFELPELIVNNNQPEAKKIIGPNAKDAIGIHASVAAKMSGADFDGDTVLVLPNNDGKIKTSPSLDGLKGFDPQAAYPHYEGMVRMTPHVKGVQMGLISNLITDMTIGGATNDELARAVRHSMVVIDAEKHYLDYKASAVANGIPALKAKYQTETGGAKTLISRSGMNSKTDVAERKQGYKIDPTTGKKIYTEVGAPQVLKNDKYGKPDASGNRPLIAKAGDIYIDPKASYVRPENKYSKAYKIGPDGKKIFVADDDPTATVKPRLISKAGEVVAKTEKVPLLSTVDDAHELSSGMPIEEIYANHSNKMKALGDEARLAMINTKNIPYSPSAAKAYAPEVNRLKAALHLALSNAPLERHAQVIANAHVAQKRLANPDMDNDELKTLKIRELATARAQIGAEKKQIVISDKEWAAIQAGAITNSRLTKILDNADLKAIKERATPNDTTTMTSTRIDQARQMLANGNTRADVADRLGVSVSTLSSSLDPKKDDGNG